MLEPRGSKFAFVISWHSGKVDVKVCPVPLLVRPHLKLDDLVLDGHDLIRFQNAVCACYSGAQKNLNNEPRFAQRFVLLNKLFDWVSILILL